MPGTLSQFRRKGRPVGTAEGEVGSARKNVTGGWPVGVKAGFKKDVTFQLLREGQVGNRNRKQRAIKTFQVKE